MPTSSELIIHQLTTNMRSRTAKVGAILSVPFAGVRFSGETFIEAIDYGILGNEGAAIYSRSTFRLPDDGFDAGSTEYFLELVGSNSDMAMDAVWTVYPFVSGAPDTGSPQTIEFDVDFAGRIRSTTPFIPDSRTRYYQARCPDLTSTMSRLRVACVTVNSAKFPSEIRLSSSSGATQLDQTIGGGDLFRTTSSGEVGDGLGYVSVGGPRFTYFTADWITIDRIVLFALMANASFDQAIRFSELAFWDVDTDLPVALLACNDGAMFLNPLPFEMAIARSLLTNGHTYEIKVRSVKASAGANFNTYFHDARLQIYLKNLSAWEIHSRCGNQVGVAETRAIHPAGYVPSPDMYLEVNDEPGTGQELRDFGASDISSSSSLVTGSEAVVPTGTSKRGRSGAISLTEGHRYAVSDALQASIIYKIPSIATPASSIPPSMDARFAYIDFLALQGFNPNRAITFHEGTGVPEEFYTELPVGIGGAPEWALHPLYGYAGRLGILDNYDLGNSTGYLELDKGTILLIRAKRDLFARASYTFSVADGNARFSLHLPYSDGKVYFDYGESVAPNRVEYDDYALSANLEAWAFRAGTLGMSIWKDGVQLPGSSATAVTRNADTGGLLINAGAGTNGDRQNIYFFVHIPDEVDDATLATFTKDNVLLGM